MAKIMELCKAPNENREPRNLPHEMVGDFCKFCGFPGNYEIREKSENSEKPPFGDIEWCPACRGSGEVRGDVTWTDEHGEVRVRKNVFASEWVLDPNPLVPLWSINICGICHGTGMNSLDSKAVS